MSNATLRIIESFMNWSSWLRKAVGICIFLMMVGCSDAIRMPGFEAQKWKADPNGCKGDREKLLFDLLASRDSLLGHSEMDVKTFLGKPESNHLRTRGQKVFEYEVAGSTACGNGGNKVVLKIRFDALNRVTEISR
jgi:hypothetical protein